MYLINYDDDVITYNDIDDALLDLNKVLSNTENKDMIEFTISSDSNIIRFSNVDGNSIIFNYQHSKDLQNKYRFIPYFIFKSSILHNINFNTIKDIQYIDPETVLNILTYKEPLLNPYKVLVKIFNAPEELIFQTFILFLNKTVSLEDNPLKINIDLIYQSFFINYKKIINEIPMEKYHKLLMFYMSSNKILPFMLKFNKYYSKYDNLF